MPLPIFVLTILLLTLFILAISGLGVMSPWLLAPVLLLGILVFLSWVSKRTTGIKKSWPIAKWLLIGGGILALGFILTWGDMLWMKVEQTDFSFANDTGPGRLIAAKYGKDVAELVGWGLLASILLIPAFWIGKAVPWSAMVSILVLVIVLIILYAFAKELLYGVQTNPSYRSSAQTPAVSYHGLVGQVGPVQVTLKAGRLHSFDWTYPHCVLYYPKTGITAKPVSKNNQVLLQADGIDRTVWIRTLKQDESWLPPGGTQRGTCS